MPRHFAIALPPPVSKTPSLPPVVAQLWRERNTF